MPGNTGEGTPRPFWATCTRWYFAVPPRPAGHFISVHRNKVFYTSTATARCARASTENVPMALWLHTLRCGRENPDWGPRKQGRVGCVSRAALPRTPWPWGCAAPPSCWASKVDVIPTGPIKRDVGGANMSETRCLVCGRDHPGDYEVPAVV